MTVIKGCKAMNMLQVNFNCSFVLKIVVQSDKSGGILDGNVDNVAKFWMLIWTIKNCNFKLFGTKGVF